MSDFFCMAMTCFRQPSICHDSEGRHHKVMGAVLVLDVVRKKTEQTPQSLRPAGIGSEPIDLLGSRLAI